MGVAPRSRTGWILFWASVAAVFFWSAHRPFDRLTWMLEVLPAVVGAAVLAATHRKHPLTPTLLVLIGLHMVLLMVGGHYTYARVPLFDRLSDALGWTRNHYDRLGHWTQGFVPVLIAREVLLRRTPLRPGGWLFFLGTCVALSISAAYELAEWGAALAAGGAAEDFLGTQGDPWDTQTDMALALLGAMAAQTLLARRQDREMEGRPWA